MITGIKALGMFDWRKRRLGPEHHSLPANGNKGGTHHRHHDTQRRLLVSVILRPSCFNWTTKHWQAGRQRERLEPQPPQVGTLVVLTFRQLKLHIYAVRGLLGCTVAVLGLVTLQQVGQLCPEAVTATICPSASDLHTLIGSSSLSLK